ncbi:MAG: hypothetical protein J7K88_07385 [Candidatus Fermentibacteraceae bacterium]|nr:hypothetical protein [Candidatus Fermentibacteraceae bacterium]
MKKAIAILAVLSLSAFAGQIAIIADPIPQKDADWLQYDDGTPAWLTWGGMYRGVWFDVQDFVPGEIGAVIVQSEFWFYHHADYPWDTSDVYLEIWNGGNTGPVTRMDQTMVTAIHYAPVFVAYSIPFYSEQEFWALANTEMSAGGWPSVLGDGTPGTHSFYSDDFIIWEPWGDMGDYFVRVKATIPPYQALDSATWASLKAAF